MKHYSIIFLLAVLVSPGAIAQKTAEMGNTKDVINEVTKAIKKESTDKKVKKEAKKTETLLKDDDCPPEEAVTKKEKSPIDGAKDQPKKKVELYFNLQFKLVGKNGENSFQEVGIPRLHYYSAMSTYAYRNGMTKAQVMALPEDQRREILMNSDSDLTGQAKTDAVENVLLLSKIASFKGSPEMYSVLEKEMSKASFGRKVNFLANFLGYLGDNYDYASIAPGAADKKVTDAEMMVALEHSMRTGGYMPAGVCRHMHQVAVRLAQSMGIKEAFGVSFNTTGSSAHLAMVLTSPEDPTKVVQLNYGSKSEKDGVSGPAALSQNHSIPDTGIRLSVWNAKNEHAITLPTEQGAILNKVTGGEDSDLSPNLKSDSQIKQVGVATPYGTIRVFHAETTMGNQTKMMGGAYSLKVNYNDVFYGEYGVAGFTSERPVQDGTLKTKGVYGQTTQGFNWKFYRSEDVNLSTFGELHLRGSYYCTSTNDQKDCDKSADSQIDLTAGLMARYHTGPVNHKTSLVFQTQGELNNSYNGAHVSVKVPVVKLSHDTDFKITSSIDGNVGGSVTMYNLGTGTYWTYNGHGGINSKKTGTYFGVSADGRLTNNTPFWLPGAEHTANAVIQQSIFNDKLFIGIDGKQSLDVTDNRYLGLTLGGTF